MKAASASDYREQARRRLPRFLIEYIDGGSYDEVTLAAKRDDLRWVALRQRVLRDVSDVDTSTTLFGQSLSMPVAIGPIGLAGMNARRGRCRLRRRRKRSAFRSRSRQCRRAASAKSPRGWPSRYGSSST